METKYTRYSYLCFRFKKIKEHHLHKYTKWLNKFEEEEQK